MIVHYLVIWMQGQNMHTRKETPMDLELETIDEETAEMRYLIVKNRLANGSNISANTITIINICRL